MAHFRKFDRVCEKSVNTDYWIIGIDRSRIRWDTTIWGYDTPNPVVVKQTYHEAEARENHAAAVAQVILGVD